MFMDQGRVEEMEKNTKGGEFLKDRSKNSPIGVNNR